MELTIIETSAYLEMRKQFSLLAVQLEDFRKRLPHPHRINDWTHKRYVWL